MPLWRVTCAKEQRYVVAPTISAAKRIAEREWANLQPAEYYVLTAIEQVRAEDPWT